MGISFFCSERNRAPPSQATAMPSCCKAKRRRRAQCLVPSRSTDRSTFFRDSDPNVSTAQSSCRSIEQIVRSCVRNSAPSAKPDTRKLACEAGHWLHNRDVQLRNIATIGAVAAAPIGATAIVARPENVLGAGAHRAPRRRRRHRPDLPTILTASGDAAPRLSTATRTAVLESDARRCADANVYTIRCSIPARPSLDRALGWRRRKALAAGQGDCICRSRLECRSGGSIPRPARQRCHIAARPGKVCRHEQAQPTHHRRPGGPSPPPSRVPQRHELARGQGGARGRRQGRRAPKPATGAPRRPRRRPPPRPRRRPPPRPRRRSPRLSRRRPRRSRPARAESRRADRAARARRRSVT